MRVAELIQQDVKTVPLDASGKVVGVISTTDIVRAMAASRV